MFIGIHCRTREHSLEEKGLLFLTELDANGLINEVIVYRELMYAKPLQIVQSLYSKPKGQVITEGSYVFYCM